MRTGSMLLFYKTSAPGFLPLIACCRTTKFLKPATQFSMQYSELDANASDDYPSMKLSEVNRLKFPANYVGKNQPDKGSGEPGFLNVT